MSPQREPESLDALLEQRYPTLHAVVREIAVDPDASRAASWVGRARASTDEYAAEQKSRKKSGEAREVRDAYELAAWLAVALSGRELPVG